MKIVEPISVKQRISLVQRLVIVFTYAKLVRSNSLLSLSESELAIDFLVIGQFEKRERPKVIAEGHRDAVIDCLYKNSNTGDVGRFDSHIHRIFFVVFL